jgi:hypothetical protein
LNISNSSLLNNVPYDKSLNRLVLGATLSTVGTPDWFHMTTVMLVPATIPALESHVYAESFKSLLLQFSLMRRQGTLRHWPVASTTSHTYTVHNKALLGLV